MRALWVESCESKNTELKVFYKVSHRVRSTDISLASLMGARALFIPPLSQASWILVQGLTEHTCLTTSTAVRTAH